MTGEVCDRKTPCKKWPVFCFLVASRELSSCPIPWADPKKIHLRVVDLHCRSTRFQGWGFYFWDPFGGLGTDEKRRGGRGRVNVSFSWVWQKMLEYDLDLQSVHDSGVDHNLKDIWSVIPNLDVQVCLETPLFR